MANGTQEAKSNQRASDNAIKPTSKLHASVVAAITESNLLERVREFRRTSQNVSSTNGNLSELELSDRAQCMLQLKQASEQFYALLSPINVGHLKVLQELELEQTVSRHYWHTLFLTNDRPEQNKFALDSLCSKLYRAKNLTSDPEHVRVNQAPGEQSDPVDNEASENLTTKETNPNTSTEEAVEVPLKKTATTDASMRQSADEPAVSSDKKPAAVAIEEVQHQSLNESSEALSEKDYDESLDETAVVSMEEVMENSVEESIHSTTERSVEASLEESAITSMQKSLDSAPLVSLEESLEESLDATAVVELEESLDEFLDESQEDPLDTTAVVSLEELLEDSLDENAIVSLEEELEELEESLDLTAEVSLEEELGESLQRTTEASLEDELDLSLEALLEETTEETFEVMPNEFSEGISELFLEAAPEMMAEADGFSDVVQEGLLEDSIEKSIDSEPLYQSGVSIVSSVDVVPECSVDVVPESTADVVPESSADVVPDSSADVVPDSSADVVPDRTVDLVSDSTEDTVPDSTVDVVSDRSAGVVPADVTAGVSSDRALLSLVTNLDSQDSKTIIPARTKKYETPQASKDTDNVTEEPVHARGGAISGLITGICTVLLPVLATLAFAPGILQTLQMKVSVVTTQYRLIMLLLVVTLTTSFFLWVSKFIGTNVNSAIPISNMNSNTGFFSRLFDINASPRRIVAGAMGPVLLGLGQGISIAAGYGTFGLSVLLEGIHKTLFVPFWFSHTIIAICCYLLAWFWGRVPLGLGTLATLLLIGPAISFGSVIVPEGLSLAENISVFALGLFLFALGIALAASAALGPDAFSSLSLAAERVNHWNFPLATLLWDITAITSGMILGGSVGIATAIGLLTVPLLLHLLIPPLRHLLH